MKIKYLLISALVTVVSINSCSSFLDEENISNQSAEAYFATPAGYESLVRGAYNGLAKIYNTTTWYSLSQLGTDISTQNNGNSTNQLNQYVTYYSDNPTVSSYWNALYAALKNANAAIGRASSVITKETDPRDGMDASLVARRVAEAKYLRALSFSRLYAISVRDRSSSRRPCLLPPLRNLMGLRSFTIRFSLIFRMSWTPNFR